MIASTLIVLFRAFLSEWGFVEFRRGPVFQPSGLYREISNMATNAFVQIRTVSSSGTKLACEN